MRNTPVLWLVAIASLFWGCGSETIINEPKRVSGFEWNLPRGIYAPRVPQTNPITNEKVALGRYLFYDTRLSANQTQSCFSCHLQKAAFADHNKVGIGSTGAHHVRNPQGLSNAAYYTTYTWANPALGTLEDQIFIPIGGDDPIELGVIPEMEAEVLARFENNATYVQMFHAAFPEVKEPFKIHYIVKALASFVRTLNSFNSPYDRYMRGDKEAMSDAAIRGMNLFNGEKAECFHCHGGDNFSDSTADEKSFFINQFYHNIGLYNIDGTGSYPEGNQGLYEISYKAQDRGRFKAPILRNVALTAPYMHDGSMATLEEVIELHSNGGRNVSEGEYQGNGIASPLKHDFITAKHFSAQEKSDLLAFLNALSDEEFINDPRFSSPFEEQQ
jgi:cytochrome c peroxidase